MARNEQLTITNEWTELTNAASKAMALSISSDTPPQAGGLLLRFQAADPSLNEVGHFLRIDGKVHTFDLAFLGGRAWARSAVAQWPVKVYVDTFDI